MEQFLKKVRAALPILVMAALALILGIALASGKITISGIISLAQGRRGAVAAVLLLLYALKGCCAVIIFDVLVLAAAAVFPLPAAIAVNAAGLAVCLTVSFLIGRFSRSLTMESTLAKYPKFRRYFENARDAGLVFCFAIHMMNLSLEVQGVIFGLMRIPYWKYLIGSFFAVLPGMLCFTIIGHDLDFGNPIFWAVLAFNIICIVICAKYLKKNVLDRGKEQD